MLVCSHSMDGEENRDQQNAASVIVKIPLSQRSLASLNAARPSPRTKMTTSRPAMLNWIRLIDRSPQDWNNSLRQY